MSIIQEALRKAGSAETKEMPEIKREEIPVPQFEIRKSDPVKRSAEPKHIYYAMTGFLLIILFAIIVIVSRSSQPAIATASVKKIEPTILPKIERREEPMSSSRRKENIGGFVLNGIMHLVDGPRAIINDVVVGEGETINGAKVEKIKKDGVLLKYNDSEVVLNINKSS